MLFQFLKIISVSSGFRRDVHYQARADVARRPQQQRRLEQQQQQQQLLRRRRRRRRRRERREALRSSAGCCSRGRAADALAAASADAGLARKLSARQGAATATAAAASPISQGEWKSHCKKSIILKRMSSTNFVFKVRCFEKWVTFFSKAEVKFLCRQLVSQFFFCSSISFLFFPLPPHLTLYSDPVTSISDSFLASLFPPTQLKKKESTFLSREISQLFWVNSRV